MSNFTASLCWIWGKRTGITLSCDVLIAGPVVQQLFAKGGQLSWRSANTSRVLVGGRFPEPIFDQAGCSALCDTVKVFSGCWEACCYEHRICWWRSFPLLNSAKCIRIRETMSSFSLLLSMLVLLLPLLSSLLTNNYPHDFLYVVGEWRTWVTSCAGISPMDLWWKVCTDLQLGSTSMLWNDAWLQHGFLIELGS